LKFWNETTFHFLLFHHFIGTLDSGFLCYPPSTSLFLAADAMAHPAPSNYVFGQPFFPLGSGEAATDATFLYSLVLVSAY
jgi:hypothetical protein